MANKVGVLAKLLHLTEQEKIQRALQKEAARIPGLTDVYYHGSPSGKLVGGKTGLHLGTREAAKQALEARIGRPAEGEWDGTREYGTTLLSGRKNPNYFNPGYNMGALEEDYFPALAPTYSTGEKMDLGSYPVISPYYLNAEMTNTKFSPHEDFKANGYMAAALKRGNAKRGYFYRNIGEDAGSISVVLPGGEYVLPQTQPTYIDEVLNYINSLKDINYHSR